MKRVALVTGGSRGIGFGIAQHLAREGFNLCITGRRPQSDVQETISALEAEGAEVLYQASDLGVAADRVALVEAIKKQFGALHVLVNNAGVAPKVRLDLLETSEESFDFVVGTNLKGAFFLTQLVANYLVEQKKAEADFEGCIINISSISATVASVNRGEYCIAKAGLSMCTQLFAVRLGEYNIPVYEIRPGVTKTDMTSGVTDKYDKLIEDGLCVTKRWGFPEDVAKATASLSRGDFPYSTGQVIMVDGGLTLSRL